MGFVDRHWNPQDRRYQQIRMTDSGRSYIERAMELLAAEHSRWSEALGPGQLRQLRDDLALYVKGSSEDDNPRPLW